MKPYALLLNKRRHVAALPPIRTPWRARRAAAGPRPADAEGEEGSEKKRPLLGQGEQGKRLHGGNGWSSKDARLEAAAFL